jgi:hypothetical protein
MRTFKKEQVHEVGMIAALMFAEITPDRFYQKLGGTMGVIGFMDLVSSWALEFFEKNKKTDWEDVIMNGAKPLSQHIKLVSCWDDSIIDFAWAEFEKVA